MNAPSAHLTPETIADYFADTLSESALTDVEEHVAACDQCALASQDALAAGAVVDQWTAQTHGQAARSAVLVRALLAARERTTVAALRDRLATWADRWAGQAEAVLRVVLERPGQAARVLTDGLDQLTRPGAAWQFAPATAAIPTRGAARRGAPQPIVVTAGGAAGPSARVAVSGERGEVAVRIDGVPAGAEPPLVLLLPTDRDLGRGPVGVAGEPRVAAPEPSPGSDAWIARFEGLEPGDYLVIFEPLA